MAKWTFLLAIPLALGPVLPPALAQPAPAASQPAAPALSSAELQQLLAPIALYPDELLTQVLVAASYPLEVVMAARWVALPANKALSGDALLEALNGQDWDASVKSLVPFPDILKTMSEQLDWTQQLGDAFLAQQADVFAAVQALRGRADAAGTLKSNAQQTVTQDGAAFVIAPAQPQTVFVPVYSPTVVFGAWPYPSNPPIYFPPPPGAYLASALATGLAFGAGIAITGALWGWGRPNWGGGNVNVNVNRFNTINSNRFNNFQSNRSSITSNTWQHNAAHRRGVAYSNPQLRQQFRPGAGTGAAQRDAFRGRAAGAVGGGGGLSNVQRPSGGGGLSNVQRPSGGGGLSNVQRPSGGLSNVQRPSGGGGLSNVQRPSGGGGLSGGRPGNIQRPSAAQRPAGAPAFRGVGNGSATRAQAAQGRASRATMPRSGGGGASRGGGRAGGLSRGGR